MSKSIHYRKLHGLESKEPSWAQIGDARGPLLSDVLEEAGKNRWQKVFLAGTLEQMSREYVEEPLSRGWVFADSYVHKYRAPFYHKNWPDGARQIQCRLIGHRDGWLPGCEDAERGADAWRALEAEWKSTGLPLLSSPAATGKALLWESLPRGVEFPSLDDDLATLIRAHSPQHRLEQFWFMEEPLIQYDGRWMYAAMCGLDRFPIGQPKRVGGFVEYQPGIYKVRIRVPDTWNHVGLIPVMGLGWQYPCKGGDEFTTWAFEPELTLALKHRWEIMEVYDGYAFDKGRPLLSWSNRLIEMRERLQKRWDTPDDVYPHHLDYAAAAVRQVLNHTIGAMHRNDFEREMFISDDNFRKWRRENPDLAESETRTPEKVPGGYLVPTFVKDTSQFAIFMPHWSATLYSLARARVAEWALRCDPSTLVKINGDAIYSTVAQPELDKLDTQRLGQPRRK